MNDAPQTPAASPVTMPAGVVESSFLVHTSGTTLAGTLAMPEAAGASAASRPLTVVLIVAGSGPTDRNGDNPAGVHGKVYAQLAWGLAQQGIASLRYDKRGIAATPIGIDPNELTIDLYVADVRAAADSLHADGRFSRVVLAGHSEGAGLALQAANRGAPAAGIIMISGAGRPILDILHSQLAAQFDSAAMVAYDSAMARFIRGEPSGVVPPPMVPLFMPYLRNYMRTWSAYDPATELRTAKLPVLLVTAARDIQVDRAEHARLVAARPSAAVLVLPTAAHVLKAVSSTDRTAQIPVYADAGAPIVRELVPGIVRWIATLR